MNGTRKWGVVAIAIAVALAVVTSTTASARVEAAGTTRGVTAKSIKVGALVSQQFFGDALKGATARFDRENAKGGVFGRKIDASTVADDKLDPNANVQATRQLVLQDKVFAIVPTVTVVLGTGAFVTQQKVPMVGWGISQQFCETEWGFSVTGCVIPGTAAKWSNPFVLLAAAKALGKDPKGLTVALAADDSDASRSGNNTIQSAADSLGMKVVYNKANIPVPPASVGDFTPFVQDIMGSNGGEPPDIAILFTGVTTTLGLQKGLQDAGFKGPIENTSTYDPTLAGATKGGSVYIQFGPFETAGSVKGVKQMVTDLEKAGAKTSVLAAIGWFAADMFIAALKKTGKNLTAESFQKAANKMKYSIKDTIGPTQFPKDHEAPVACGAMVTSNGTGFDVTVPYFCTKALPFKG